MPKRKSTPAESPVAAAAEPSRRRSTRLSLNQQHQNGEGDATPNQTAVSARAINKADTAATTPSTARTNAGKSKKAQGNKKKPAAKTLDEDAEPQSEPEQLPEEENEQAESEPEPPAKRSRTSARGRKSPSTAAKKEGKPEEERKLAGEKKKSQPLAKPVANDTKTKKRQSKASAKATADDEDDAAAATEQDSKDVDMAMAPNDDDDDSNAERNYWLLKAEPETRLENGVDVKFSIDDLAAKTKPEPWDGIRNYVARNNLRAMKKGDLAFFYHSNCKEPGIVGTMEIVQEHSPDLSAHDPNAPYYDPKSKPSDPKWSVVHVEFRSKFAEPIGLKELRSMGDVPGKPLANMQMLKQSRLSVSRVSKEEWEYLVGVAEGRGESITRE